MQRLGYERYPDRNAYACLLPLGWEQVAYHRPRMPGWYRPCFIPISVNGKVGMSGWIPLRHWNARRTMTPPGYTDVTFRLFGGEPSRSKYNCQARGCDGDRNRT